jgi:hypothetical protein
MFYIQSLVTLLLLFVRLSGSQAEPILYRHVERNAATCTWTVEVTIHAPGLSSMARYTEYLPEAAQVKVLEQGKSEIRRDKERLKFIWTDYPTTHDAVLRYTLVNCESHFPDIKGRFDYVLGDNLKKVVYLKKENTTESTSRIQMNH